MHSALFLCIWCTLLGILYYLAISSENEQIFYSNERLGRFSYLYNYNVSKKVGAATVIYAATTYFGSRITTKQFLTSCDTSEVFCRITDDPNELPVADAVLFHNWDYCSTSLPSYRNIEIPYVIFDQEAPNSQDSKHQMKPAGDVWFPYGHFRRLEKPVSIDMNAIWSMKDNNKSSTWMASNCNAWNRREKVIYKLKELGLETDLYGSCGEYTSECGNLSSGQWECVTNFLKRYKFYMAFENSNCVDYVTEKFFYSLDERYMVPIVMKRKYYEDIGAPSGSFIAVDDFSSLQEMAAYLVQLASNRELYLKYHEWRRHYKILGYRDNSAGFCLLCRRLQNIASIPRNSYKDLEKWHSDGMCDNDFALKYLN